MLHDAPGDVLRLVEHPDFQLAVPTPDHFIPLLYVAALAAEADEPAVRLIDGSAFGSLSMACYGVGVSGPLGGDTATGGAAMPDPTDVPAEQTNL